MVLFQKGDIAVQNGRFSDLTTTEGDVADLEGKYVIPGLIDIHSHGNSRIFLMQTLMAWLEWLVIC